VKRFPHTLKSGINRHPMLVSLAVRPLTSENVIGYKASQEPRVIGRRDGHWEVASCRRILIRVRRLSNQGMCLFSRFWTQLVARGTSQQLALSLVRCRSFKCQSMFTLSKNTAEYADMTVMESCPYRCTISATFRSEDGGTSYQHMHLVKIFRHDAK